MRILISEIIHYQKLFKEQGNLITLRLQKDIAEKVELTQEEMETYNFKVENVQGGSRYIWDNPEAYKSVHFTQAELSYLKTCVAEKDKASAIPVYLLELAEKISECEGLKW